jgi:hypothetical protein
MTFSVWIFCWILNDIHYDYIQTFVLNELHFYVQLN